MGAASSEKRIDYTSEILQLLNTIKIKKYIGYVSIETVSYSIEKQLVERTSEGNFELTDKAIGLLSGELSVDLL